ncbi:YbaB/EbfC family nucleoid-associated protein [Gordonia sp. (in: high G+C Gram-positive bacteria)]|uniref:YbaB/EbfC family nucleoid-associated protein n=1 Tax=Gordonia sp. (in: high G+C Gram-positive bacteria) TaxID=84139 RepID=UPI0039E2D9A4
MANPQLDELLGRASAALGRMADLADGYAAVRGESTDARGLVTARVDGGGALVGLELDRGAVRLGASVLGELIVSTAMVAAQRAYAQRARLTDEFNREFADDGEAHDIRETQGDR